MAGSEHVERLQSGQLDFHTGGLTFRVDAPVAQRLCMQALGLLGWRQDTELGLGIDTMEPRAMDLETRTDTVERLRASGGSHDLTPVVRTVLQAPWMPQESQPAPRLGPPRPGPTPRPGPPVRRFTKEVATGPALPVKRPPAKVVKKSAPVPPAEVELPQLFADPVEQLRYEAYHYYLLSVPISQRDQWPWPQDFGMLPSFVRDVEEQSRQVSRGQIVGAMVDVISGRYRDVNSRRARYLRQGGGDEHRPPIARTFDGALAWRANVSHGTPAARRIMWWAKRDGAVELARFALHDDIEMPER